MKRHIEVVAYATETSFWIASRSTETSFRFRQKSIMKVIRRNRD